MSGAFFFDSSFAVVLFLGLFQGRFIAPGDLQETTRAD